MAIDVISPKSIWWGIVRPDAASPDRMRMCQEVCLNNTGERNNQEKEVEKRSTT